jgi:hypothetical protein
MRLDLPDRLLRRELDHGRQRYSRVSGIYGDRQFVQDLDIVNELEGHRGCVNALRSALFFSLSFSLVLLPCPSPFFFLQLPSPAYLFS